MAITIPGCRRPAPLDRARHGVRGGVRRRSGAARSTAVSRAANPRLPHEGFFGKRILHYRAPAISVTPHQLDTREREGTCGEHEGSVAVYRLRGPMWVRNSLPAIADASRERARHGGWQRPSRWRSASSWYPSRLHRLPPPRRSVVAAARSPRRSWAEHQRAYLSSHWSSDRDGDAERWLAWHPGTRSAGASLPTG